MNVRRLAFVARKKLKKIVNEIRGGLIGVRGGALKVAVVSCDRWKGKVYDDLLLQGEFLRQGVKAEIVSWQDPAVEWGGFDVAVVGSMWGYQDFLGEFEQWLGRVGNETKLVNSVDVIRRNYNKAEQFRALERAGVPIIKTQVVRIGELGEFKLPEGELVVKPAVSGSGENTFLVKDEKDFGRVESKLKKLNKTRELLVQPFVPEIRAGELGVVVIGDEIMNVVRRFPGVIEGGYKLEVIRKTKISRSVEEIVRRVAKMSEYKEASYIRVDMVERKGMPVVMEVEAFEPQLYYYLLKGKERKKMLMKMVKEVMGRSACETRA